MNVFVYEILIYLYYAFNYFGLNNIFCTLVSSDTLIYISMVGIPSEPG